MRLSIFLTAAFLVLCLSLPGCGGGGSEATAPAADELSRYVDENADQMAEQEEIDDMEDVEEEEDDDE